MTRASPFDEECKVIEGDQVGVYLEMYTALFHLVLFDFFIFMCWFFDLLVHGAYLPS